MYTVIINNLNIKEETKKQKTSFQKVVSFRVTDHRFKEIDLKIKKFDLNRYETFRRIAKAMLNEQIQEKLLLTYSK